MDGAKALHRGFDQPLASADVAQVCNNITGRVAQIMADLFGKLFLQAMNHDACTGGYAAPRNGFAHAGGRARNEDDFVLQQHSVAPQFITV